MILKLSSNNIIMLLTKDLQASVLKFMQLINKALKIFAFLRFN